MTEPTPKQVTQLLLSWNSGDAAALDQLMPVIYQELRRLAAAYLRRERPNHTLQPTALVHEAYLRLVDQDSVQWQNRAHFFGVAARLVRQILIDHARRSKRAKRGGGAINVPIEELGDLAQPAQLEDSDLVALDDALTRLESIDERGSRIVELRFFGGLSIEETAAVLAISPATVKRDWTTARAWLFRELQQGQSGGV